MTAVAKTERGLIKDPAFLRDIHYYDTNVLNPFTPVAMLFASVLDANRYHYIAGCATCYAQWKALT